MAPPYVAPNELIASAWGNAVVDDLAAKLYLAGGTMTGDLAFQKPNATIYFYEGSTLHAYIGQDDETTMLSAGAGGLRVLAAGTDRLRILPGGTVLVHKFDSNLQVPGVEMPPYGSVQVTQSIAAANLACYKNGAAVGNGQAFALWHNVAALIGSITMNAALNGVQYNTTSDKRLKTVVGPVDGDAALDKLAATEPVNFIWNSNPDAGEQVGFLAQDLFDVAPEAVTPGNGEPGDDDFRPWGTDLTPLVPTLIAAVNTLATRNRELEARLDALEDAA